MGGEYRVNGAMGGEYRVNGALGGESLVKSMGGEYSKWCPSGRV